MLYAAGQRRRSIDSHRATGGPVAGGIVRIAATMAVPTVLREFGVNPVTLLAEFGLKPQIYDDPDNTVPFVTSSAILGRAAELTGCPHFGLLVGQRAGLSTLGPLGFLMQSSLTVRSALMTAAREFRTHRTALALEFSDNYRMAMFGFRILIPDLPGRDQHIAGSIAVAFNVLRSLCGPAWHPYELRFAHAAPADRTPFRRFFNAPLVFDASESSVVFASRWLDREPPGADSLLNLLMRKRIAELEAEAADDLVAELRRILPSVILAGEATVSSLAGRVGFGERSLNRHLAAQGTSVRALVAEVRGALARQLLQDTRLAVSDIGERLGYANPSAFTRAFRRWTGNGPAHWRASQRIPSRSPSQSPQ
jgi:AraC-like DNA-binding protein